jgi:hypothetical protein
MTENTFLKSWRWQTLASLLIFLAGIIFWRLFLVGYIYERLHIGIGLGGAVYPVLFAVPVLGGAAAWQCMIRSRIIAISGVEIVIVTAVIPMIITCCCLFILCPTDSGIWLPGLLLGK